jgi:hypothetical protein
VALLASHGATLTWMMLSSPRKGARRDVAAASDSA